MSYEYRKLAPSEHRACFAGNGECFIPAAYGTDDGKGLEVYVCQFHRDEMDLVGEILVKLSPEQFAAFEAAIAEQLGKQAGLPPALPQWRPKV